MRRLKRKDIRDLSEIEWNKYKKTFLSAKDQGLLDEISEMHTHMQGYGHFTPRFLPWHRMLLLYLEELLQVIAGEEITIPYWDWTKEQSNSPSSYIFSEKYWGCKNYVVFVPERHVLVRKEKIDRFYNNVQIKRLLKRKMSYDDFTDVLELVPHAIVHLNIGGDMQEYFSPNDPLFWHHHSFVDFLWDQKVLLNGKYSKKLSRNEILFPFGKKTSSVLGRNRNIKYVPYKGVTTKSVGSKKVSFSAIKDNPDVFNTIEENPPPLSKEYIKKHCYKESKVRRCEYFMIHGKWKHGFIVRFLFRFFNI